MINPEMLTGTFTYLARFHATCHSINVQTRTEEHSCDDTEGRQSPSWWTAHRSGVLSNLNLPSGPSKCESQPIPKAKLKVSTDICMFTWKQMQETDLVTIKWVNRCWCTNLLYYFFLHLSFSFYSGEWNVVHVTPETPMVSWPTRCGRFLPHLDQIGGGSPRRVRETATPGRGKRHNSDIQNQRFLF